MPGGSVRAAGSVRVRGSGAVALPGPGPVFARYGDVVAALADPALVPVPVPVPTGTGAVGSMAWLRATVARFSAGGPHAVRRAFVEADLAGLDPAALRVAAAAGFEADTRVRTVRVLAQALGLAEPEAVARAVVVVAGAYFVERPEGADADGAEADGAADAAVAWLLPRMLPESGGRGTGGRGDAGAGGGLTGGGLAGGAGDGGAEGGGAEGGGSPEWAANRIGLLVQACDATATLVEHTRRAFGEGALGGCALGGGGVGEGVAGGSASVGRDQLLAVLRQDPPVRTMRRRAVRATGVGGVAVPAGADVLLDVAAAQADRPDLPPLTFGAPPRLCPGRTHALAIAAGILYGASGTVPAVPGMSVGEAAPAMPAGEAAPGHVPDTDGRDPAGLVPAMVEHVLALADTWTEWDGRPLTVDGRTFAPHKAIRRVADHLVDHLAELEARLAGEPTRPDHWHASACTTPADLAPFTRADLDEARSRLTRLARIWAVRLGALTAEQLDRSPGPGWSFRQIAFHVAESVYYADAVGDLRPHERTTDR
ncbi:hypothetical protein ACFCX4_01805 [Kitasatospora sp. NPDC056327]|uniref:hypothetical protein n=1 Tax=Kitasatospora sp. NPDC056327 TaxID=3345785 RepID=UPI0035E3B256